MASAGILVAESKRCLVEHNISVGNRTGIAVRQQGMRIVDASGDPDRSLPVTFYSERLIFRRKHSRVQPRVASSPSSATNPSFGGSSGPDKSNLPLLDPSGWNWQADHNVYFAPRGTGLLLWGAPWRPLHKAYDSLNTFRSEHKLEEGSIVADPRFVGWDHGDFSLRPDSAAIGCISLRKVRLIACETEIRVVVVSIFR